MSIILAEAAGGAGGGNGTTNYSSILAPQKFNPDAGEVTANTADFTLSGNNSVAFISMNGKVLDDAEYSLAGQVLTVTPVNGFDDTDDEVLVFQHTFSTVTASVHITKARKTADYALTQNDYCIIGNATANDISFTLPEITADRDGDVYLIGSENITVYTINVDPSGSDTIGNNSEYVFTENLLITLIADYSTNNWLIQE